MHKSCQHSASVEGTISLLGHTLLWQLDALWLVISHLPVER